MPKTSSRIAFFVGLIVALGIALSVAKDFAAFPGHADRLPTWDPSAHGMDGVLLADAVRDLSPVAFFKAIYLMSYWPPVFPLMEVPGFVLHGYDFHVARDTVAVMYVLTVLAAFAAGFFLTESVGLVTGLATAALIAASPAFKLYSNLEMAEVPAAFLQLLGLALFFAFLRFGSRRLLLGFCLSLTLLFFTKYNNGLLVVIALTVFHAVTDSSGRKALHATVRTFFTSGTWRRPFYLFAGLYLAALAVVFLAGGISFSAFGRPVFIRTVGNPLYVLILLAVLRWAIFRRVEARHLIQLFRRLGDPYRAYVVWFLLPVAIWMINPNNLRTFFLVVTNEAPAVRPSLGDMLLFYPRAIVQEFIGSHSLGIALFCLAAAPLLWVRKLTRSQRFLYLSAGLTFFLSAIHQNQIGRYAFPLVPLLYLGAAFALTRPLAFLSRNNRAFASLAASALILAAFWHYGRPSDGTAQAFVTKTSEPSLAAVVDFICAEAKAVPGETTLLGFWDELPPGLVQWRCRQERNDVPLNQIPKTPNRLGLDYYAPDFAQFLGRVEIKQIFVARYRTDPPQSYLMHYRNERILPLVELLEKDPRFAKASERTFETPWYRIAVYRRL